MDTSDNQIPKHDRDAGSPSLVFPASDAAGGGGRGMPPATAGIPRRYSHYDPFRLRYFRFDPDTEAREYEPEEPPLTERQRRIENFKDDKDRNGDMDR